MAAGGKTCFKEVASLKLGDALARDASHLPAEWAVAAWCENYEFRAGACARTWARPHAQDNLMCARLHYLRFVYHALLGARKSAVKSAVPRMQAQPDVQGNLLCMFLGRGWFRGSLQGRLTSHAHCARAC